MRKRNFRKKEEMNPNQMSAFCRELYNLPGENLVTSGPMLSTTPAASWPRTNGNGPNLPFSVSLR